MATLIYDGSFEGLLTAVFDIYERRLTHVSLVKAGKPVVSMFDETITIVADEARAQRVWSGLQKKVSPDGLKTLYVAFIADAEEADCEVLGYVRYAFDSRENIEDDYRNRYVRRVGELARMAYRERHRMEAFVRFQKLKDDLYYASIAPDFNVLPLLVKHFKDRYADQKWMIYDGRRGYGIFYDLHDVQFVEADFDEAVRSSSVSGVYADDEKVFQDLWRNYFNSTNIKSRKNNKLHLRHIPKRYWRYLTEKL